MRSKKPNSKKQNVYDSTKMEEAINAVNAGTTYQTAAKLYGVPRTTLRRQHISMYRNKKVTRFFFFFFMFICFCLSFTAITQYVRNFGILCCLTTPGLRKDIRRQIRQFYSHQVLYYVYYY